MVKADRYPSRHRLRSNNSQNKKLFSDKAIGTFHKTKWTVRTSPPPGRNWKGASEAAPEAVRQAVGRGCQSGCGRLLSVTNATGAGACRHGGSGWPQAGGPGGGVGIPPPLQMHLPPPPAFPSRPLARAVAGSREGGDAQGRPGTSGAASGQGTRLRGRRPSCALEDVFDGRGALRLLPQLLNGGDQAIAVRLHARHDPEARGRARGHGAWVAEQQAQGGGGGHSAGAQTHRARAQAGA